MPATDPTAEDLALLADGALTVPQATVFAGVSRRELFYLMGDGDLPWFHYGRNRMIPRKALVAWLARQYAVPKAKKSGTTQRGA